MTIQQSDRFRSYWTKRYSMDWIVETASMIWGPQSRL